MYNKAIEEYRENAESGNSVEKLAEEIMLTKAYLKNLPTEDQQSVVAWQMTIHMANLYFRLGCFRECIEWCHKLYDFDVENIGRPYLFEREFYIGITFYELSQFTEAWDALYRACQISGGRCFQSGIYPFLDMKKYQSFYQQGRPVSIERPGR